MSWIEGAGTTRALERTCDNMRSSLKTDGDPIPVFLTGACVRLHQPRPALPNTVISSSTFLCKTARPQVRTSFSKPEPTTS